MIESSDSIFCTAVLDRGIRLGSIVKAKPQNYKRPFHLQVEAYVGDTMMGHRVTSDLRWLLVKYRLYTVKVSDVLEVVRR